MAIRNSLQLGVALKRQRLKKNLTQAELAEQAGLKQASISTMENGQKGTKLETLFKAITALNLEIKLNERGHGG